MTEQYKRGWTDPRTMSTAELFADYVATKAQVHKPWVGLTDEEVEQVFPAIATYHAANKTLYRSIARAIEDKLKEKNHG